MSTFNLPNPNELRGQLAVDSDDRKIGRVHGEVEADPEVADRVEIAQPRAVNAR